MKNFARISKMLSLAVLVVGCTSAELASEPASEGTQDGAASSDALGAAPQIAQAAPVLKPVLRGLLDRQGKPATTANYAQLGGWVVGLRWRDLEPTQGTFSEAALSELEASISEIRSYNKLHPTITMGIKLRVLTGSQSPDWVKSAAGPTFQVILNDGEAQQSVPRFWTAPYRDAYRSLMQRLGKRYDGTPEVRDVVMSACTTIFAEPMVRETWVASNVRSYLNAGYTMELDAQCQEGSISDTALAWPTTRISESFSLYENILPDGSTTDAWDQGAYNAKRYMDFFRKRLGSRGVWGNNEAGRGDTMTDTGKLRPVYAYEDDKPNTYYQTVASGNVSGSKDFEIVIENAVKLSISQGANYVELPKEYSSWADFQSRFGPLGASLRANPTVP